MCLIIQAKNPQVITDNMMNCAYSNNDDGFGLMFHNKGKVHIHKIGKPKSFKTIQKVWDSYKNPRCFTSWDGTKQDFSKFKAQPSNIKTSAVICE